jgi:hypothetical protein
LYQSKVYKYWLEGWVFHCKENLNLRFLFIHFSVLLLQWQNFSAFGGGEFKYEILIYCKNFYKCHNVPPPSTIKNFSALSFLLHLFAILEVKDITRKWIIYWVLILLFQNTHSSLDFTFWYHNPTSLSIREQINEWNVETYRSLISGFCKTICFTDAKCKHFELCRLFSGGRQVKLPLVWTLDQGASCHL